MSEFADKVNELVNKMEAGEDGTFKLPEEVAKDLDEPTMFAVTAERRRRDTQSAYTRAQQAAKTNERIAKGLEAKLIDTGLEFTKEEKYELTQLKKEDPDKYRTRFNEFEAAAKERREKDIKEVVASVSSESELEARKEIMEAWTSETGIELTDDMVQNELPPRFTKQLEAGEITFKQFLDNAANFLKANKVIKGSDEDATDDTKDLSRMPGGREPSKHAQEGDFNETYEKTLF